MGSSIGGQVLFNSGPHRFTVGRMGRLTRGPFSTPLDDPFTTDEGVRELLIIQSGRLVAASESLLWSQVDAIKAQAELPRNGALVDNSGRSWANMTLVRFEPDDRVDRGREFSLGYTALYLRFGGL